MSAPETEAGRKHVDWLNAGDDIFPEDADALVAGIEAEAKAQVLAEAIRRVEGLRYNEAKHGPLDYEMEAHNRTLDDAAALLRDLADA